MEVCGSCRRPRKEGTRFCTGCGWRFPDDSADPAERPSAQPSGWDNTRASGWDSAPPGPYESPRGYESPGATRSRDFSRRRTAPLIIAAVAAVLVGGGITGFAVLYSGHHSPGTETATSAGESTQVAGQASQDEATPGGPDSTQTSGPSSPLPASSSIGQVTIAAAVSQDPNASSVATFLNQYFTAINDHDYQSYVSLLSPQEAQGLTQEQFDNGYGSTSDSAETLVGISTAANGDLIASVAFTSHQDPAESPNQDESCTDWNISLFLEQGGGGYLLDQPPSSYHASYQACS
jgi:hypothetical protein